MFSYFRKSKEQKELYFQIDKEFKKSCYEEKLSGIYAIYKDDICLYVGQSKNIASRLATHLSGKYKECSKILIFPTIEPSEDLIPLEKFVMQQLKPIENLLIDFTEKIESSDFAEGSIVYHLDYVDAHSEKFDILDASEFTIINDTFDLLITYDIHLDLYSNDNVLHFLKDKIISAMKSKGLLK